MNISKYKSRDACFFCSTTYQLVSAMAITLQLNLKADMYWLIRFDDHEDIISSLKETKIFENVIVIDKKFENIYERSSVKTSKLFRVYAYLNIESVAKQFILPDVQYKKVFFACYDSVVKIATAYFLKSSPSTEIHYYEDGEGAYNLDACHSLGNGKELLIRRFLCGSASVNYNLYWHLYSPELYKFMHPECSFEICKIPGIHKLEKGKIILEKVFGTGHINDSKHMTVVILDAVHSEVFTSLGKDEIMHLYQRIVDVFGKDSVLIKKHPRDQAQKSDICGYFSSKNVPFEILTFEKNMNDVILISFSSTSVVLPKIMKDEEPYVILLYHLINGKKMLLPSEQKELYYGTVKRMYRDVNKFCIPRNMEEFESVLYKIRECLINEK